VVRKHAPQDLPSSERIPQVVVPPASTKEKARYLLNSGLSRAEAV